MAQAGRKSRWTVPLSIRFSSSLENAVKVSDLLFTVGSKPVVKISNMKFIIYAGKLAELTSPGIAELI